MIGCLNSSILKELFFPQTFTFSVGIFKVWCLPHVDFFFWKVDSRLHERRKGSAALGNERCEKIHLLGEVRKLLFGRGMQCPRPDMCLLVF